jgi:hypothetical protein
LAASSVNVLAASGVCGLAGPLWLVSREEYASPERESKPIDGDTSLRDAYRKATEAFERELSHHLPLLGFDSPESNHHVGYRCELRNTAPEIASEEDELRDCSAGLAFFLLLFSESTGIGINSYVYATGAVENDGSVGSVGSVNLKLEEAARRAESGRVVVLVPKEPRDEREAAARESFRGIRGANLVPVGHVSEIFSLENFCKIFCTADVRNKIHGAGYASLQGRGPSSAVNLREALAYVAGGPEGLIHDEISTSSSTIPVVRKSVVLGTMRSLLECIGVLRSTAPESAHVRHRAHVLFVTAMLFVVFLVEGFLLVSGFSPDNPSFWAVRRTWLGAFLVSVSVLVGFCLPASFLSSRRVNSWFAAATIITAGVGAFFYLVVPLLLPAANIFDGTNVPPWFDLLKDTTILCFFAAVVVMMTFHTVAALEYLIMRRKYRTAHACLDHLLQGSQKLPLQCIPLGWSWYFYPLLAATGVCAIFELVGLFNYRHDYPGVIKHIALVVLRDVLVVIVEVEVIVFYWWAISRIKRAIPPSAHH